MRKFFKIVGFLFGALFLFCVAYSWLTYVFLGHVPYGIFENQDRMNVFLGGCLVISSIALCASSDNIDYK